ncbi:CHAP domain-containing protein [Candidatus Uhrbacteria bacterium]|nr:CHAP domain-containing protein [Candidatus Uhrbacteria bacterium]
MIRRFPHLFLVWIVVCVVGVAGYTFWRLNTGWTFRFIPLVHGTVLGEYEGVTVHAYGWGDSVRGEYGLEYECVELVNRYYVQVLGHRNLTKTGHADSYFWDAQAKGLQAFPNGGVDAPAINDILVFDGGPKDGSIGHVAVVIEVDVQEGTITFIEQNMKVFTDYVFERDVWKDSLPLTHLNGEWFVESGNYSFPIAGWSRPVNQSSPTRSQQ